MALKDLKKNSSSLRDKLLARVKEEQESSSKKYQTDDRFWDITVDKAGEGSAVIRFLPPPVGEDDPFVSIYKHAFKGPTGQWYIENCLSTIEQDDPVNDMNRDLWNSGDETLKKQASAQKRKLTYMSNILVISDPAKPENEGKVFVFRYGKKIFDKLVDSLNVDEDDDSEGMNPFDPLEGANFSLKCAMDNGFRSYDKSKFLKPKPLFGGDEKQIDEVLGKVHSLAAFVAPEAFKSYDELKGKLEKVLGVGKPKIAVNKPSLTTVSGGKKAVRSLNEDDEAFDSDDVDEDEKSFGDGDVDSLESLAKYAEDDE